MKRAPLPAILLTFACLGCSGASSAHPDGGADDAAGPPLAQRDLDVPSMAMGRAVHVRVLLPASFADADARTYPVLYLLHGANEPLGYRAFSEQTELSRWLAGRDVIVAMPEGGQAGWYSDWARSCAASAPDVDDLPRWETFHTDELPRYLAEQLHASGVQAVAGVSMGGFGALSYTARHPGMYRAAASFSGAVDLMSAPTIVELSLALQGCKDTDAVWGDPAADAARWAEHDPYALADALVDVPLYVSSGDGTPGPLDAAGARDDQLEALANTANRAFVARLRELGAGDTLRAELYGPGSHSWPYFGRALQEALPGLLDALEVP